MAKNLIPRNLNSRPWICTIKEYKALQKEPSALRLRMEYYKKRPPYPQKNNSRNCCIYPEQFNQLLCNPALQCFEIPKEYLLQSFGLCTFQQAGSVRKTWPGGGTGGHGNESVTVMPQKIPSARSAGGMGCYGRWKKYTTSCRWQKAWRGKPCVTVPALPCEDSCGAWRPLAEKVTGRKPNKDGITCLCVIS